MGCIKSTEVKVTPNFSSSCYFLFSSIFFFLCSFDKLSLLYILRMQHASIYPQSYWCVCVYKKEGFTQRINKLFSRQLTSLAATTFSLFTPPPCAPPSFFLFRQHFLLLPPFFLFFYLIYIMLPPFFSPVKIYVSRKCTLYVLLLCLRGFYWVGPEENKRL